MTHLAQITNYQFPNIEYSIMRFQIRLSEIARSHGFRVENLIEDGLGEALAMYLRLPSGHVALFAEYQHLIKHHRVRGPDVFVDGAIVAEFGPESLITEVLESLSLSQQTVDWTASIELQQIAIDMMKRVAACKNPS